MARRDAEFTEYVAKQRTTFLRAAYLLCGDWAVAEDVVQIVLVKAYLAWPRIHKEHADAYLRRMIARTAIDQWRSNRRSVLSGDDVVETTTAAPEGLAYEERHALLESLRLLPARQRQVVVLRHWWGCSVAEVARDLRITEGTVKSQTARALERLKVLLAAPPDQSKPKTEMIGES
jgi:RNA polymerase sigma-70 factor (sigma-E family)